MPVALALAAGLLVLVGALALTLSGSPVVLARANAAPANQPILEAKRGSACQTGEFIPAGTSAIRLTLVADAGPRVSVGMLSGKRQIAAGATASGWTSGAVTVPVKHFARPVSAATICFKFGPSAETVQLGGAATSTATAARTPTGVTLLGRFTVEYLRSGPTSWWSLASVVAHHFGLGRAPAGDWVAWMVVLVMAICVALASYLTLRELE